MRKLLTAFLMLSIIAVFSGCSKKEEDAPQKISAPIDNNDPKAATAPSAQMDESPGALAARMGGKGMKGKLAK